MKFLRNKISLFRVSMAVDVCLILLGMVIFVRTYDHLEYSVVERIRQDNTRFFSNLSRIIEDFATREADKIQDILPVFNALDMGTQRSLLKALPFKSIKSLYHVSRDFEVQRVYIPFEKLNYMQHMDISQTPLRKFINESIEYSSVVITPIFKSLMTESYNFAIILPVPRGVLVAEVQISRLFRMLEWTGLFSLQPDTVMILIKPRTGVVMFRSSAEKYPYWKFDIQASSKAKVEGRQYYFDKFYMEDFDLMLVILTPDMASSYLAGILKKYFLLLFIIAGLFYLLRAYWNYRALVRPLRGCLENLKGGFNKGLELDTGFVEWQSFEDRFNEAIYQLKQSTSKIVEVRRNFQTLFDSLEDSILVLDYSGNMLRANPEAGRLFECAAADLTGKSLYDFICEDSKDTVQDMVEQASQGQNSEFAVKVVSSLEHEVNVEFKMTGGIWDGKECVFGIARDISSRLTQQQEREHLIRVLEGKNAELERFTYTVSHDLKSPIVTIKGFLGLLAQSIEEQNKEEIVSNIEQINTAADRMAQLLHELLELSRIGRIVGTKQSISFNDVVKEALQMLQGRISESKVIMSVMPDMPQVYGDHKRLVEVVQNLIENAMKYMGNQAEPEISVGTYREEDSGEDVFFVRDNGMGISEKYSDKIFGLFETLDSRSEGSGIGLAIVKRIIENHNGRIWVESKGEGQGATFCFTLGLEEA